MRIIIFFILIISPFSTFSNEEDILSLENLYIEKRCITCHVIGRGKFVGPDLYNVFNKYSDKEILQWIKNPQEIYKKYNSESNVKIFEIVVTVHKPNTILKEKTNNLSVTYSEKFK